MKTSFLRGRKARKFPLHSFYLLALLTLGLSVSRAETEQVQITPAPVVTTDKPEYGPGSTALINGSGFDPGEMVWVQVLHADGTVPTEVGQWPQSLTADAAGQIRAAWHVCGTNCPVQTLRLSALGAQSGRLAQASFSNSSPVDSNPAATIATSEIDYSPNTAVSFTGTGWQPGETVAIHIIRSDRTEVPALQAIADAQGEILNRDFSTGPNDSGISFAVVAYGQDSGQYAYTKFYDSHAVTGSAPSSFTQTASSVQLTIYGANFDAGPVWVVLENGSGSASIPSTMINANTIRATIPAAIANTPGTYNVAVWQQVTYCWDYTYQCGWDPCGSYICGSYSCGLFSTCYNWCTSYCPRYCTTTECNGVTHAQYSPGGLTIRPNQAPILKTAIPAQEGTYGTPFSYSFPLDTFVDPDPGQSLSYTATGLPPGISFQSGTRTFSGTPQAPGSYTVLVTATDNSSAPLATSTTFTFSVDRAPLTVTADNQTMVLGGTMPVLTASYSGFLNGDTPASLTIPVSLSTTASSASPVGAYDIIPSGGSSPNYNITFVKGWLSIQYEPLGFAWGGNPGHVILPPIKADGSSTFKQGSTIPAKFRVYDAQGNSIGTPGVVSGFYLVGTSQATLGTIREAVSSTTPDTTFRWDPTAQQWIFNLSTKSLSASNTYYFEIDLNDGTSIAFQFQLR